MKRLLLILALLALSLTIILACGDDDDDDESSDDDDNDDNDNDDSEEQIDCEEVYSFYFYTCEKRIEDKNGENISYEDMMNWCEMDEANSFNREYYDCIDEQLDKNIFECDKCYAAEDCIENLYWGISCEDAYTFLYETCESNITRNDNYVSLDEAILYCGDAEPGENPFTVHGEYYNCINDNYEEGNASECNAVIDCL